MRALPVFIPPSSYLLLVASLTLSLGCSPGSEDVKTPQPTGDDNGTKDADPPEETRDHCKGQPAFKCVADQLFACDAPSGNYLFVETCENDRCNDVEGKCQTCVPGTSSKCTGPNAHLVCNESGHNWQQISCGTSTPYCTGDGTCVECQQDSDCPSTTLDCRVPACIEHSCTTVITPDVVIEEQTPGDCKIRVCGKDGVLIDIPDITDLPPPKEDSCQVAQCTSEGVAQHVAAPIGTSCPAGVCNAEGVCRTCITGDRKCAGERSERLCNDDGEWGESHSCPETKPICGSTNRCVGVTSVKAGGNHSCALFEDGHLWCWGSNECGQLGIGNLWLGASGAIPQRVTGLPGKVDDFSLGYWHTCARVGTSLWCWGSNSHRQLGVSVDKYFQSEIPVQVDTGSKPVIDLSARHFITCFVTKADGDPTADLICSSTENHTNLIRTGNFSKVSCGEDFVCTHSPDGPVACLGSNTSGQLGVGSFGGPIPTWTPINSLSNVHQLSLGASHALALSKVANGKGNVQAWGNGSFGQLLVSETTTSQKSEPHPMHFFEGQARAVAAGSKFSCIITPSGALFCSGKNNRGQLALGNNVDGQPFSFGTSPDTTEFVQIGAGAEHACALTHDGSVKCWGAGTEGQIGNGKKIDQVIPIKINWLFIRISLR